MKTGAVIHRAADGVGKLQVRMGDRGRGLFAASSFKKGATITHIAGTVMDGRNSDVDQHAEKLQWSKTQVFVMHNHKVGALGVLTNTAVCKGANNARFVLNRRNQTMIRLCATKPIAAGQEILAPYGRTYVSQIKKAVKLQTHRILEDLRHADVMAPVVIAGGAVQRFLCAKCGTRVTKNTRHGHARCCSGAINK
jgi:hypothetical protein